MWWRKHYEDDQKLDEDERLLLCKGMEDTRGEIMLEHQLYPLGFHVPGHTY